MPAIIWSNGKRDSAGTWQTLLNKVRRDQGRKYNEQEFRVEMQKRAMVWSGEEIDPHCTPEQFFLELQWARLIKIEKED